MTGNDIWDSALEAAALILESSNNYDNPMTSLDCADAIRALKGKPHDLLNEPKPWAHLVMANGCICFWSSNGAEEAKAFVEERDRYGYGPFTIIPVWTTNPGTNWQPMKTAPRDGTGILALLPDSDMAVGVRFSGKYWTVAWDGAILTRNSEPVWWMPILDAPTDNPVNDDLPPLVYSDMSG